MYFLFLVIQCLFKSYFCSHSFAFFYFLHDDDTAAYLEQCNDDIIINMQSPRSAVGNVSGYRCVSDCRSRGREFDPGPVPYSRGD